MTVNNYMHTLLSRIICKQPAYEYALSETELSSPVVSSTLINMYSETQDAETKELIIEFMEEAGSSWLRNLIIRDPSLAWITL
ncbi:MAG: hypothetical protein HKN85_00105 [Gammaproteobacteria bacterium]|nr:hypothetical protein [Gammaproteobacteria bacterium]